MRRLSSRKRTKTHDSTQATACWVMASSRHASNVCPVRSASLALRYSASTAWSDRGHVVAARLQVLLQPGDELLGVGQERDAIDQGRPSGERRGVSPTP